MTKELKEKWVKALRSGEYEQGRKRLKQIHFDDISYCCLGVLCDLIDPNGWEDDPELFTPAFIIEKVSIEGGTIPDDKFFARRDDIPSRHPLRLAFECVPVMELVKMNDGVDYRVPYTFAEIADYIEKNVQPTGGDDDPK